MHLHARGRFRVDPDREAQELLAAMLRAALAADLAVARVQRGCSRPDVVVCFAFRLTWAHGQQRLRAIQYLHLVFLIQCRPAPALASLILRGWSGRGAAAGPASQSFPKRARHLPTAGILTFRYRAA